MPSTKKISCPAGVTGKTLYCIVRRNADNYRLNDADGNFASNPADPYLSLSEDSVVKGLYEVSESRQVWENGSYIVFVYQQTGGSPAPASDYMAGVEDLYIENDSFVTVLECMTRLLGLTNDNVVEDDIVRDDYGNKVSGARYCYDNKNNATTHDKSTGLISRHTFSVGYTNGKMSLFKMLRQA